MGGADAEWVDAANDYPELLSFDGLELLGFDFKGTANVLMADGAAVRDSQPRKGMRLLFVIREKIVPCVSTLQKQPWCWATSTIPITCPLW